jgi:integrase
LEAIPKGLADRWRDRPLIEISADDIFPIVDEAREYGTPGLEKRVVGPSENRAMAMFATLSSMFSWLLSKRRITANPCVGVSRPKVAASRDRVLKDVELVAFWKAASAERMEFAAPLKLLLLTGARLNEVVGMRRSELSDDGASWIIPGGRTKNRRECIVPLAPLARHVLTSVESTGEFVFSTTGGRRPITCGSKIKSRLDAVMKTGAWRLHDVRRSVVTGMAELGIRPDVIELVVNHVSGHRGGIAGVYNRSEMLPERRAALERWAAHVEGLVSGKVVKIMPLPSTQMALKRRN